MTLKQLQARNNALMQECNTLRIMLSELRAGNRASRAQRLRNARIKYKNETGGQLCLG